MLAGMSPYAHDAAKLRENGYSPMPVQPGTKTPGQFSAGHWRPMPGWQKYCKAPAPDFVHSGWENWPEAGVCIAHGSVIGLDLDTDRADVAEAVRSAVPWPEVRRRGRKGWMGYYRPAADLDDGTARLRWYDPKDGDQAKPLVELLLHGTQSVVPPTIHPDTGRPYEWIGGALTSTDIADLPEFGQDTLARLEAAFTAMGLTRKAPRRANLRDYDRPAPSAPDLEKPFGRSLNDRALHPGAMDRWWPALDMPKTRQRGPGAWEAVAFWRSSGSGRSLQDRNPNLRSTPQGIVDFGADRAYTAIDVVMAARDCSYPAAVEWLEQYVEPEQIVHMDITAPVASTPPEPMPAPDPEPVRDIWAPIPVFPGTRSYQRIKPVAQMTDAEYAAAIPADPGPFPIADPAQCGGLLGELASYLDRASATSTEAGGLAVALPLLGAIMGRAYQTPTRLRTNVYTVAIGASGSGKTSLVSPAKEAMRLSMLENLLGQDRIASGSGLLKMLDEGSAKVCFLDEFGHMLKSLTSYGAGVHAKQIITEFTQLYSAANTLFTGTAAATQQSRQIDCPHLCLFGMATPDQFWQAFGSGALEDGSVARYLVFPLGETAPKEPSEQFQGDLLENIGRLKDAVRSRVTGNLGRVDAMTVPFDAAAEAERHRLIETMASCADYADRNGIKGGGPILRRVAENAAKIALISAVGRDPVNPMVTVYDFQIGHALARWSASMMVANIASHIADNQYERDVNEVERFIKEGGDAGRDYRDVQRKFRRVKARDLKEIVEALVKEQSIAEHVSNDGGRWPIKRYASVPR